MTPTLGSFVAARVVSSSSASSSLATRVCLSLHLRLLLFPGAHHHLPRAPVIRLPRRSASPGASSVLGNKHRHASFRGGFHHLRGVHFLPLSISILAHASNTGGYGGSTAAPAANASAAAS